MTRSWLPAICVGVIFSVLLLAGCDSAIVDGTAPDDLILAEGNNAQARVDVCHVNGQGDYIKITVAEAAYDTHVAHGDAGIGEPVPGLGGYVFDEDCEPTQAGGIFSVGTEGGTFTTNDGLVTLIIPIGAFDDGTEVMVTPVSSDLDDPDVVPGLAFEFFPSPRTFAEPVILTVIFDPSSLPTGISEDELRLLAFEGDEWVQLPGSSVNAANSTVGGPLDSFSRKAVGRGKVDAIAVLPENASIGVGEAQQFEATLTNVDGEVMSRNVQWSSSNDGVATIDNTGHATGVALGQSTIEARAGNVSGSAGLSVAEGGVVLVRETISAGGDHSCGIDVTGEAYCWGSNQYGQLGTASTASSTVPVRVELPAGVRLASISAGYLHTVGLTAMGEAYAWGFGLYGQMGDGTNTQRSAPVAVLMPTGVGFVSIGTGYFHTVAVSTAGTAYTWGFGGHGALGDGTEESSNIPLAIILPGAASVDGIAAGYYHTVAITSAGGAYAWGVNNYGQLGDGSRTDSSTPVDVVLSAGVRFTSIAAGGLHTVALTSAGKAYGWGSSLSGQLGRGGTNHHSTIPGAVLMPEGVAFASIDAGSQNTGALTTTGSAYAWGSSLTLGDGTTTNNSGTPVAVAVPEGARFISISVGGNHMAANSTTGTAYAWGFNSSGQLGDGTTTTRNTPVEVSTITFNQ